MNPLGQHRARGRDRVAARLLSILGEGAGLGLLSEVEEWSRDDWGMVAACAQRHALGPLLHHQVRTGPLVNRVPPDVGEALRLGFLTNAVRNELLLAELGRVGRALGAAGIPVLVLKGAFLALQVYGHPACRPMNDLDLLVPVERLRDAGRLLLGLGYSSDFQPDGPAVPDRSGSHHLPRFQRPPTQGIEVHWTLVPPYSGLAVDVGELWTRSVSFEWGGMSFRALCPEHLILHLAVHASRGEGMSLGVGLRPFCDLDAVLRKYDGQVDWDRLSQEAVRWQLDRRLHLMLALVAGFLDSPIPRGWLEAALGQDLEAAWIRRAREVVLIPGRHDFSPEADLALGRIRQIWESVHGGGGKGQWAEATPGEGNREFRQPIWKTLELLGYLARHPGEAWQQFQRVRTALMLDRWFAEPRPSGDPRGAGRAPKG